MNNEKKRHIRLLLISLLFAAIFIGAAAYLVITYRGTEAATDTILTLTKILALIGVFFLVLAFGHVVPAFVTLKKRENGMPVAEGTGILSEKKMQDALGNYIPDGETLLAGIHAVGKESSVTCVFKNCILTEDALLADDNGNTVSVSKSKYSTYDLYIGITQNSFVVADCETYRYYYEFDKEPITDTTDIQTVTEDIQLRHIGKCFPLTDIQSFEMKNGFAGSINCVIKLKNGGYFKLLLPKMGGLGGGMPRHEEYRDAIIKRLNECNA